MYSIKNRTHRAPDIVNIYPDQTAKNDGKPARQTARVAHSCHGFDSYMIDGLLYPGYTDTINGANACVVLTDHPSK